MTIQIPDKDVKYLKELICAFNNIGAYVHEGVRITVDYNTCMETREACQNLIEFRDKCIFPEYIEALDNIYTQLDGYKKEEKNPDEFVFRIKKSDFNDPDALEEGIKDMKLLIGFLCNANPNYYLLGNVLQEQLKEQLEEKKND